MQKPSKGPRSTVRFFLGSHFSNANVETGAAADTAFALNAFPATAIPVTSTSPIVSGGVRSTRTIWRRDTHALFANNLLN